MSETVFTTGELRLIAQKMRNLAHRIDGSLEGEYQTRLHDLARKLDMLADEYDQDTRVARAQRRS